MTHRIGSVPFSLEKMTKRRIANFLQGPRSAQVDADLSIDDRESWERAFEHEPHEAGRRFAQLQPNREVARRNALGVGEDADYRATAGTRLGVDGDVL